MSLRNWAARRARWGRAILFPIGDVPGHLCRLTARTCRELAVHPAAALTLGAAVMATCNELGLVPATGTDRPGDGKGVQS